MPDGFDWRATPETARMFGPQGMFAPFYARRQQQFQLLERGQQQQFQERQQRAAFDYATTLMELRERLQQMAPAEMARTRLWEAQATEVERGLEADVELVAARESASQAAMEAIEAGDYPKAAEIQRNFIAQYHPGQMPEEPETRYLVGREGEVRGMYPGPFTVAPEAREPTAAVAGAITPSVARTSQRDLIRDIGRPLDTLIESRVIRDVYKRKNIGRPKIRELLERFRGPWTQEKQSLFDEIVRERLERAARGQTIVRDTDALIANIRNLLYYGRIVAGEGGAPESRMMQTPPGGGRRAPGFGLYPPGQGY